MMYAILGSYVNLVLFDVFIHRSGGGACCLGRLSHDVNGS